MPRCSHCNELKNKEIFSKNQLKRLSSERRCKDCVSRAETESSRATQVAQWTQDLVAPYVEGLVNVLLQPGRAEKLPDSLSRRQDLKRYLKRVFASEFTEIMPNWAVMLLMEGLLQGGEAINALIPLIPLDQGIKISILIFVSSWKNYKEEFKWNGGDEMVQLVLATPGIRVNNLMPNKTNALHHAATCGTAKTVQLLLDAGVDFHQKDHIGHSCLKHAVEQCQPDIVSILVEHLPVTEMLSLFRLDASGHKVPMPFRHSLPDKILCQYLENISPISWRIMGRPSVEDVKECLFLLRMKGAKFTKQANSPIRLIGAALAGRDTDPPMDTEKRNDLCQLGNALMGLSLPNCALRAIETFHRRDDDAPREEPTDCPICLDVLRKPTTLYCGHTFCRKCITEYGRGDSADSSFCPVCRRRLCADIRRQNDAPRGTLVDHSGGNIDNDSNVWGWMRFSGLENLGHSQLEEEARADGFYSQSSSAASLRAELLRRIEDGYGRSTTRNEVSALYSNGRRRSHNVVTRLELLSNGSMFTNDVQLVSATNGPPVLEIFIHGVPIIAHISNNSRYTLISKSLVEAFGLKRIEKLSTRKMRYSSTARRIKNKQFTCIDGFSFQLGSITVSLRNAMEVDPDLSGVGIVLGQDFFLSAPLCFVDVNIGGDDRIVDTGERFSSDVMRTDGLVAYRTKPGDEENIRYYSHNGESEKLPLFFLDPFDEGSRTNFAITIDDDTEINECSWCCRKFPDGMMFCSTCSDNGNVVQYCDEDCQRAAFKIHKARYHQVSQPKREEESHH